MSDVAIFQEELAVLRRLAGVMTVPPSTAPDELPLDPALHFAAKAAYFLLDMGRPGDNIETFITYTLGRLLRQLNHNTEQRQVAYQGRVRGRISWSTTFKARHAQDYDPTRYVCREVRHQYNTPENQLLKYLVERLSECLAAVPAVLRAGACYFPPKEAQHLIPIPVVNRLEKMESAIISFRRNVRLQDVSALQCISELHLLRAETARLEEYNDVVHIYKRYQMMMGSPVWNVITDIGKRVLLLPGRSDAAGDPWIQLGAVILRA